MHATEFLAYFQGEVFLIFVVTRIRHALKQNLLTTVFGVVCEITIIIHDFVINYC